MATCNDLEQRTIIKLSVLLGKTPTDMHKMLETFTGKPKVCPSLVYKRHKRFSEGLSSTKVDSWSGRPGITNTGLVANVKEIDEADRS